MDIDFLGLEKIAIDKKHLINVRENIKFNESVVKHYKRLLFSSRYFNNSSFKKKVLENPDFDNKSLIGGKKYTEKILTLENKLVNLCSCNSYWLIEHHERFNVKDFLKTNLCKDRFCHNCKKVKQASRMARFIPEIDIYKDKSLYHLTLTVPNVEGDQLKKMIKIMFASFTRLVNFFNPKRKKDTISGIDFNKYGYLGAIRSLEVTYKNKGFHPHIHCLFALDYAPEKKVHVNKFSRKFGEIKNYFSDTEILIQKLWRLLIESETVNFEFNEKIKNVDGRSDLSDKDKHKKTDKLFEEWAKEKRKLTITRKKIDKMELGYSCNMDLFKEDDYHELFKYMTKAVNDDGDSSSFQDFLHLYFQLKSIRQIQGYGVFFRIHEEDNEEEVLEEYNNYKDFLNAYDPPVLRSERTDDLIIDDKNLLISRKKIYGYLREIVERENRDYLDMVIQKEKKVGKPS